MIDFSRFNGAYSSDESDINAVSRHIILLWYPWRSAGWQRDHSFCWTPKRTMNMAFFCICPASTEATKEWMNLNVIFCKKGQIQRKHGKSTFSSFRNNSYSVWYRKRFTSNICQRNFVAMTFEWLTTSGKFKVNDWFKMVILKYFQ